MKRALLLLFTILTILSGYSQNRKIEIKGKVTDEKGEAFQGVNIKILGTMQGTVTDINGTYSVNVTDNQDALVFSFIGYVTDTIHTLGRSVIDLSMTPDIMNLEQVVVIGYGTKRKSDLTGSVSSIDVSEGEVRQTNSVEQLIQGKAAGVQITTTSSKPGGAISVKIRGNNSINAGNEPLYVIDGFPISSNEGELSSGMTSGGALNALATINPNDIESIEILKDASATSIYGARATNGVVLITTKRGAEGKGKIELNVKYGYQKIRHKMEMLDARQFGELVNEALVNEGLDPLYDQLDTLGKGTDWQDELFRTARVTDVNLSFSGGKEKTRYFLGLNYLSQDGIIINTDLDRIAFKLGLDMDVKPWLTIGSNLNLSNVNSNSIETSGWGVINTALIFNPMLPVKDENGDYTVMNDRTIFTGNPIALANEAHSKSSTSRAIANTYFTFKIRNNLYFKSSFGVDAAYNKEEYYYPSTILAGMDANGIAGVGNLLNYSLVNENTLNYDLELNSRNKLNFLVGFTDQTSLNEVNRVAVEGFSEDILKYDAMQVASKINSFPNSYVQGWSMLSFLGRIDYTFSNKYLFSVNARMDGSSKFGKGNKYGFFPSVAAGWKLSEEEFLRNFDEMNLLKLRISYGFTGNQEIPSYQSLAVLSAVSYPITGNKVIGYHPTQIANPDLKWETTKQFDIGLDAGFLNNRIQTTVDYYYKKTDDLLLYVNLPVTSGFTSALKNIGSVQNKGMEFSLSTKNLVGTVKWSTDFNIAFNRNKVLDLAGVESMPVPSRINQLDPGWIVVGQPIGLFYGLKTDGLFQNAEEVAASAQPGANPGDIRYIDYNGDGVINMDDRQQIGASEPKFFGGLMNSFSYNNIELIIFLQGSYGNDIFNANLLSYEYPNGLYNQFTTVLDRWTPENTDAKVQRASAFMQDAYPMDRFVEDGSYLRLKTLTLSYDLSYLVKKSWNGSLKIYLTTENLLTWTNYSGYDPEVNYFGKSYLTSGYDWGSYPSTRNYFLGLKLSF